MKESKKKNQIFFGRFVEYCLKFILKAYEIYGLALLLLSIAILCTPAADWSFMSICEILSGRAIIKTKTHNSGSSRLLIKHSEILFTNVFLPYLNKE